TADPIRLLEHGRGMAHPRQLLRAGEASGTRADNGDAFASAAREQLRLHPTLVERAVGDRALDRFDGDRIVVDVERARRLARGGADAAGDLREVVGLVQTLARGFPILPVD